MEVNDPENKSQRRVGISKGRKIEKEIMGREVDRKTAYMGI